MSFATPFQMMGDQFKGQAQAGAATYNASIARQNVVITQQQGVAASQAQTRDSERKIGSMIASYGASGVQSGSGSAVDVLVDSARIATLDNLTTQYNYALKAQSYANSAVLDDYNAKNAGTAATLAMYTDLAQGVDKDIQMAGMAAGA